MSTAVPLSPEQRSQVTFRQDLLRGACYGILEAGAVTFTLMVAIRAFDASPAAKGTLASAYQLGLLLTPLSFFYYARMRVTAAQAAAANLLIAATFLALATFARTGVVFIAASIAASVFIAQQGPLLVHIYTANYASARRGRMLSASIIVSLLTAMTFSTVGGRMLDRDLASFRLLFGVMTVAALLAAWAVARMPTEPFAVGRTNNPLAALRYLREDRMFGAMIFVWMLMGIGNLMMLPLRVEYLANPVFGINATNTQIVTVTLIVPSVMRLATTHFWGSIFDRHNFFLVRTILNGFFFVGILLFFATHNLWIIGLGGACFGLGMAGSNIAWSLWVTKFAPPDRVAEYMSVHTFFTGIRGVAAPYLGFFLIIALSPFTTACIGAGFVGLSMILLDPLRRRQVAPLP